LTDSAAQIADAARLWSVARGRDKVCAHPKHFDALANVVQFGVTDIRTSDDDHGPGLRRGAAAVGQTNEAFGGAYEPFRCI
jgi:hypothetical protein